MRSKYFKRHEFACGKGNCKHCGGLAPMASKLVAVCDYLREKLGHPITVNSGFRCVQKNIEVNGAAQSFHKKGMAADLGCSDPRLLFELQTRARYDEWIRSDFGLILYPNFLHIDCRCDDPFAVYLPYYEDKR